MPLGTTRDVLLIIRAKDQASRVVNDMGRTMGGLDKRIREANKAFREEEHAIRQATLAARRQHAQAMTNFRAQKRGLDSLKRAKLEEIQASTRGDAMKKASTLKIIAAYKRMQQDIEAQTRAEKALHRTRLANFQTQMMQARISRDTHINEIQAIGDRQHRLQMLGSSYIAAGAAAAGMGATALRFLYGTINQTIAYNKQVAYTSTQLQKTGANYKEISDLGLELARNFAIPFENIQPALYDIFSSLDIGFKDATILANQFAKAAVAGNVTMQEAGRGIIQILNGMGMGYGDVNRVLDVQFQMVRRGIGTYKEFAGALGLAIPQSHALGQSFETLAGSVAFMTRIFGGQQRSAAISYTRFLEILARPEAAQNLHKMGVSIHDSSGNMRELVDIAGDLTKVFGSRNQYQQAKLFKEIFGTSTVQARRFFFEVIKNYPKYQNMIQSMYNTTGEFNKAYTIMAKEPANQIEVLKNRWKAFKKEAGDALIPVLNQLISFFTMLLQKWQQLSPETRKTIIQFGAVAAIATTLIGVLAILVGSLMILRSAFVGLAGGRGILGAARAMSTFGLKAGLITGGLFYLTKSLWDGMRAGQAFKEGLDRQIQAASGNITKLQELERSYLKDRAAIEATNTSLGGFFNSIKDPGSIIRNAESIDALTAAHAAVSLKIANHNQNTRLLSQVLGISQERVLRLAKATGTDLTGAMDAVIPKILSGRAALYAGIAQPALDATASLALLGAQINLTRANMVDFLSGMGNFAKIAEGTRIVKPGASFEEIMTAPLGGGGMSSSDYAKAKQALVGGGKVVASAPKITAPKASGGYGGYGSGGGGTGGGGGAGTASKAAAAARKAEAARERARKEAERRAIQAAIRRTRTQVGPLARVVRAFDKTVADQLTAGQGPIGKAMDRVATAVAKAWKKNIGKLKADMPKDIKAIIDQAKRIAEEAQQFREEAFRAFMGGGIVEIGGNVMETYGEMRGSFIIEGLRKKLNDTKKFAADLQRLAKMGLDPRFLRELVLAGVEEGGPIAAALASGPAKDIKEINQIQKQIEAAAKSATLQMEVSLYAPGQKAIQSLIEGLRSKFPEVKAVLQELTRLMGQWKGPESVDRKLLVPQGRVIMEGLRDGLHDGYGDIRRELQGITRGIGATPVAAGTGARGPVTMTVYTQEINPVKHAADLGWEVARRVG